MQPDVNPPARVEMCANRFELICRWGEPLDWEWAHEQLTAWLRSRVDAEAATVYDGDILMRGDEHV